MYICPVCGVPYGGERNLSIHMTHKGHALPTLEFDQEEVSALLDKALRDGILIPETYPSQLSREEDYFSHATSTMREKGEEKRYGARKPSIGYKQGGYHPVFNRKERD